MEDLEAVKQKLKELIPTIDFYKREYRLIAKYKGWTIQIGYAHTLYGYIEITSDSGFFVRFKDYDIMNYALTLSTEKQLVLRQKAIEDFINL